MRRLAVAALIPFAALQLAGCTEPASPSSESLTPSGPAFGKSPGINTTRLGTLPNGGASIAWGINSAGTVIVGYAYPSTGNGIPFRAVQWTLSNGTWVITDLAVAFPVGTTYSLAYDLNSAGTKAGYMRLASGDDHAYTLSAAGVVTDLHPLVCAGDDGRKTSYAHDVGENGEAVGTRYGAGLPSAAFYWDQSTGCAELLPSSAPSDATSAEDINDHGVIAGFVVGEGRTTPVRWTRLADGSWDLDTLPLPDGIVSARPSAINNEGEIVGTARDAANEAFPICWDVTVDANGVAGVTAMLMPMLGESPYAGYPNTEVTSINEAGDAAGWGISSTKQNAARWPATGGVHSLVGSGTISSARDLNDKKQIVGSILPSNGPIEATLWTLR